MINEMKKRVMSIKVRVWDIPFNIYESMYVETSSPNLFFFFFSFFSGCEHAFFGGLVPKIISAILLGAKSLTYWKNWGGMKRERENRVSKNLEVMGGRWGGKGNRFSILRDAIFYRRSVDRMIIIHVLDELSNFFILLKDIQRN